MKKTMTVTLTPILALLLCSACGASKHGQSSSSSENGLMNSSETTVASTAPDGISRILATNTGASDEDEENTLSSSNDTQDALNTADESNNEATRKLKLKKIDKKFMENFKTLSKEEKKAVIKETIEVLKALRDLSEEDRKEAILALEPPLPSKKVLNKILPKRKKQNQGTEE